MDEAHRSHLMTISMLMPRKHFPPLAENGQSDPPVSQHGAHRLKMEHGPSTVVRTPHPMISYSGLSDLWAAAARCKSTMAWEKGKRLDQRGAK